MVMAYLGPGPQNRGRIREERLGLVVLVVNGAAYGYLLTRRS